MQLKDREQGRYFEDLEAEISLMAANAKFNYRLRKRNKTDLKIIVANIDDMKRLFAVLKTRMNFLSETTSWSSSHVGFLNLATRLAINVATAPAATPLSMLTTAKPSEHDCSIAINVLTPFSPNP